MRKYILSVSLIILTACGVNDSKDQQDGISNSDHRIFVTSISFNGALGGLVGADAECAQAAANVGLKKSYKAILSSSTEDAEIRLNITGGVYLFTDSSTRVLVATSGIDLWGTNIENLKNSINRDESYLLVNEKVWSGTSSEGGHMVTDSCSDWSSTIGNGFYGSSNLTSSEWIEDSPETCSNFNRIYCISIN